MITKRTLPAVVLILIVGVAVLVKSRFDPRRQELLNDALYEAVSEAVGKSAPVTSIDEALKEGANPNGISNELIRGPDSTKAYFLESDFLHRSPLEVAAGNGNPAAVSLLLAHHANPNAVGTRGTPLHAAVESGGEEIIDLLAQHGANLNAAGPGGNTPLHIAVAMRKTRTVEHLLAIGVDPSIADVRGMTPLAEAKRSKSSSIVELLRKAGAKE